MQVEPCLRVAIGLPDAAQAGRLGRHDVNAVAVVGGKRRDAGADELHDLVLHEAGLVDGAHDGKRHVHRSDTGLGRSREVDRDDIGIGDVVGVAEQLLVEFAATFADGHRAQRSVAGMGIAAEDHLAATGEVLAHELVDDGDVRRYVDAAVLLGGG